MKHCFTSVETIAIITSSFIFFLAIVWIYNLIWFIPLDFIKFGLQAMFSRSLHAVKPFDKSHHSFDSKKQSINLIMPTVTDSTIDINHSQPVLQDAAEDQGNSESHLESIMTTLDQFTQTGASYYSPYTETFSVLRSRNSLLSSLSD
jgi:hypothetical protein